jgi:hypothetical protein
MLVLNSHKVFFRTVIVNSFFIQSKHKELKDVHVWLIQWSRILLTTDLFLLTGKLYIYIYIHTHTYIHTYIYEERHTQRDSYCSSTTGWESFHSQFSQIHH